MGRELCRNYALWQGEWENEVEIDGLSAWQSRHAGAPFRAVLRKTQNTCIRSSTSFPFGPTTVGWSPKIEDAAWCVFSPPSLPQVGTALGRAFVMILKKDAVFSLEKGAKLQLRTDQKVLPRGGQGGWNVSIPIIQDRVWPGSGGDFWKDAGGLVFSPPSPPSRGDRVGPGVCDDFKERCSLFLGKRSQTRTRHRL